MAEQVNRKMVKIFGAGGFKGLVSYGTGLVVSPNGYVLTVDSHILTSQNVRVHLHDGRRFDNVKVVASEPELDVALLKIDGVDKLPYFDIAKSAQQPLGQTGDWILAFSNQFQIATRDEPMTMQRGAISSYSKLHGRRGIHDAPYNGDVYFLDAITNNPGAGGGALTNRKGELLGIIGKELRNTLTDIWINYAMPIQAKVEMPDKDKPDQKKTISVVDFVRLGIDGKYQRIVKEKLPAGVGGFHGIVTGPGRSRPHAALRRGGRSGSPAAAGRRQARRFAGLRGRRAGRQRQELQGHHEPAASGQPRPARSSPRRQAQDDRNCLERADEDGAKVIQQAEGA